MNDLNNKMPEDKGHGKVSGAQGVQDTLNEGTVSAISTKEKTVLAFWNENQIFEQIY